MARMERIGPKLTVAEQVSRNPVFRGRQLAVDVTGPNRAQLRAIELLGAGARRIGDIHAAATSRVLAIIRPEMVTSPKLSFNIMKNVITVAMFKQFVDDSGYKIEGYNSGKLLAILADPKKSNNPLTHVSYVDATAFVSWRQDKTGKDLRIPTKDEWVAAKREVGNQLTGGLFEWTQDEVYKGLTRALCSLDGRYDDNVTVYRYDSSGIRLVEDMDPTDQPQIWGRVFTPDRKE